LDSRCCQSWWFGSHYIDVTHRLLTIAVEKNFVQGRWTTHVMAACWFSEATSWFKVGNSCSCALFVDINSQPTWIWMRKSNFWGYYS
jgi:hypothetical protein